MGLPGSCKDLTNSSTASSGLMRFASAHSIRTNDVASRRASGSTMTPPASSSSRSSEILAQVLSPHSLQLHGTPVGVASPISHTFNSGDAIFAAGGSVLAVRMAEPRRTEQLTWFDRGGRLLGTVGAPIQSTRSICRRMGGAWLSHVRATQEEVVARCSR